MSKRVLVVGDAILDRYTHGTRLGISAETPTVVARWEREETFLGGAALVARHLLRLGCDVELMTAIGEHGDFWKHMGLTREEHERFFCLPMRLEGWCMPVKHRFFVDDYKMVQYDVLNEGEWESADREVFFKRYCTAAQISDAIVICDNRHGVMDEALARCMVELPGRPMLYVDSQVSQRSSNHHWYAGADCMLMNEQELRAAVLGDHVGSISSEDMMVEVQRRLAVDTLVLKKGAEGSLTRCGERWHRQVPPETVAVDTCGAGDAFLAALVATDGSPQHRLQAANDWAARSTTYKGTVVPEVTP